MPNLTLNSQVKRKESIFSSQADNEAVMLSIEQGKYFGTNPVGTEIWSFIEQSRSVHDIIAHLRNQYDVSEAQCESEVLNFLTQMQEHELIDVRE